ncbi:MFS transporter [Nocardiopsis dassonvillei]|uniref:Major facilitator superfamily MFS_1 n=2 Tax=Nocardiopsis dassonvillei TaxID=2014 RepID=D7B4U1_NOCDD|nr:MFS transporter [Nocardiopsis dassonvillei]ADH67131.1 major facilitator superfamily MFS_1 [Nocardiopsis dassonvillei subsp. dassonvillei DSM 43111]NKY81477.1 multidrug efflux MFS transporter [Nocardiopsis dassonvillei]VEI87092.1 High-copy suppressor of rspA [Nocardiopsis dassonvillei]
MMPTSVSARFLPLAVAALAVIGFVSVLVSSVTSMALTTLAEALGTSMSSIVWVTTVFLLTAGLALPFAGWAVDRFGGRPVLLVGLAVFAAGALGSGSAVTFEQLIAARAVQGLGGGVLESACLALISQITDRRRIGAVMGLMSMVINLAPAVGPVIGAALLSAAGWRSVFLFAVPPILLAGVLLALSLGQWRTSPGTDSSAPGAAQAHRFDLVGLALLGLGFTASLFAIGRLSAGTPWSTLTAGVLGALLLVVYVRRSLRVPAPIIDPRLFTDRRFSGAAAIMGMGGVLLFSTLTLVPLLAARSWDLSGLTEAVPLAAFGTGMLVSMSVAGALSDRVGSRRIVTTAAACSAGSLALLAACAQLLPSPALVCTLLLCLTGLSFGAVSAPTFASIYRILPAAMAGRGTTAVLLVVQLGAALGVTGIGSLVGAVGSRSHTTVLVLLAGLMLTAAGVAALALSREASARHADDRTTR